MSQPIHPAVRVNSLVAENLEAIGQLTNLLVTLPPSLYAETMGRRRNQSIGKHVRHIIDHYHSFLAGLESGRVGHLDYEHRERDPALEQNSPCAREALLGIARRLESVPGRPHAGTLAMDYQTAGQHFSLDTSVSRELTFLTSHTVHHMAIIGLLAEQCDVEVSDTFGMHPSTLRHQRTLARQQEEQLARSA